ncbi:MAG: type I-E CRISPR-associated endonuclease Cas1e [Immundisolibacter sp.]
MVLPGRLGLETARVPHGDRHGLLWLARGHLYVQDGTLRFLAAGSPELKAGDYAIPFQQLSLVLLGPGSTVSHDALRLLARHGTGLTAVGEGGVRAYTAPPLSTADSALARRQVQAWSRRKTRIEVARRMYAWRLGEILPHRDLDVLRGIEGARMKEAYRQLAQKYRIEWHGRRYDRNAPTKADIPNQAINHAATAIEAAAMIATNAVGAIHQLGFIHEDAGIALPLDIADLYRTSVTIPVAFRAAAEEQQRPGETVDRRVRRLMGEVLHRQQVIPDMIDKLKELFSDGGDRHE